MIINKIHQYSDVNEILSSHNHFTNNHNQGYFNNVLAKSRAEPENSNIVHMANSNTPINRVIFVCSTHTPKINAVAQIEPLNLTKEANQSIVGFVQFLSMVACNGKGFALCCVPYVAVSQPVTRYRPKPENFKAVTSYHLHMELLAMIYQFIGISRQHYDKTKAEQIRILAHSENQARAFKAKEYVLILVGRLPNTAMNANTFNATGVIYA